MTSAAEHRAWAERVLAANPHADMRAAARRILDLTGSSDTAHPVPIPGMTDEPHDGDLEAAIPPTHLDPRLARDCTGSPQRQELGACDDPCCPRHGNWQRL